MSKKGVIVVIVLLALSAFGWEHPLKMSFSKLSLRSDGIVEVETRIFLDDLTAHMQQHYGLQQVDFSTPATGSTQALQRYLSNHFYFEQNGEQFHLRINAVSLSKNRLALVVNMNTTTVLDSSKEVVLVNTLLCDTYPVQTNDIKYLDEHFLLSLSNPKVKIRFE
ncbi:MAG: DUF6702 family protein [Bacteroidota bacterium]